MIDESELKERRKFRATLERLRDRKAKLKGEKRKPKNPHFVIPRGRRSKKEGAKAA